MFLGYFDKNFTEKKSVFNLNIDGLKQACQTQTTSWAAKALKTAKGAAKVLKSPQWGPCFTKSND